MTNKVQTCCYNGERKLRCKLWWIARKMDLKKIISQRHVSVMLSAWGIFGVFRIFDTRTAEVTFLSVDVYHSPFLGV